MYDEGKEDIRIIKNTKSFDLSELMRVLELEYSILNALFLSFLAGIATTIGAIFGLFVSKPSRRFIGLTLGFSAGVMIGGSPIRN